MPQSRFRSLLRPLALAVVLVAAWGLFVAVSVRGQVPSLPSDVQLGKPTGFIAPAWIDFSNGGAIRPSHGMVRIWSYQNGWYRPTSQVVPVDNPWPGFSFWTVQPVTVQEVNGRWTIISTTP